MDFSNLNGLPSKLVFRLAGGGFSQDADIGKRNHVGKAEPSTELTARQLVTQAVTTIEAFTQSISRNLNFSLDDSTGRVIVKVTDAVSGEVIRQIPSEEALRLAESLDEARSLLFKAEA